MRPYVKNGTPIHGPSLCDTCENAMTVKGYRESQEVVICEWAYPRLRVMFPVRDCSRYMNRTREDLEEMKKIAWDIKPRGSKQTTGFVAVPPANRESAEDDLEIVLDKFNDEPKFQN
jgi:hypothetical protein